ncbi:hypothetical protein Tco_1177273, partial [Tanacetum coccineum]
MNSIKIRGHLSMIVSLYNAIREAVKLCQLAHLVKEIKQSNAKASTSKTMKKRDQTPKDKGFAILVVYFWDICVRPWIGMNLPPWMDISFPPLINANLEDYPIVICVEIGGYDVHRMYVDGGSTSKILYEHYFLRLRPDSSNHRPSHQILRRNLLASRADTPASGLGETTLPIKSMD